MAEDRRLTKAEFEGAALALAQRYGGRYELVNLDKDYAQYLAASQLLDNSELAGELGQAGEFKLVLTSYNRSNRIGQLAATHPA
jgi:hypothetical protein